VNFRRYIKGVALSRVDVLPFLSVILLVVTFVMFALVFTATAPLKVKLPKVITSDMASDEDIAVVVTSENIIYVHERVTTIAELQEVLSEGRSKGRALVIKADRRASVGRIMDVSDMARALGIERVSVAVDQEG
jgi:biopolymer transport protein ExbD